MDWWIGICGTLGVVMALCLDYRGRKGTGRQWLSERGPTRLVLVVAYGAFVGFIFGFLPILFYSVGEAFFGLYNDPPSLPMVLALLPSALGVLPAIWLIGRAQKALLRHHRRDGEMLMGKIWPVTVAACLWLFAVLSIGIGSVTTVLLVRGL